LLRKYVCGETQEQQQRSHLTGLHEQHSRNFSIGAEWTILMSAQTLNRNSIVGRQQLLNAPGMIFTPI
jgi:hypothetical protein